MRWLRQVVDKHIVDIKLAGATAEHEISARIADDAAADFKAAGHCPIVEGVGGLIGLFEIFRAEVLLISL